MDMCINVYLPEEAFFPEIRENSFYDDDPEEMAKRFELPPERNIVLTNNFKDEEKEEDK